MEDNKQILVTLNQTGIDLSMDEIDSILDLDNQSNESKREHLAYYFKVEQNELNRKLLERYVEADMIMTRISAGSAHNDIRGRLVDTLQSAKRCYSHGEDRACIELCALFGEMLANYLCIAEKTTMLNVIDQLNDSDKIAIRKNGTNDVYFTDGLNQRLRLRWLIAAGILIEADENIFITVHDLRIKYFHHWVTFPENAPADALNALKQISIIAAKYLEILGSTHGSINQQNFDRIRRYMNAISITN